MAIFDSLIAEIGSKFGLGAKSSALIAEVIRFMTSEPGGVAGFLDRFKNAGLAERGQFLARQQEPRPDVEPTGRAGPRDQHHQHDCR